MKKFLTILLVLMIAVAFALAITACEDEEEDDGGDESVTRTFTIVITRHEDHPVTVKDTRTGKNDTDLQKLGVISRLETGLQAQTDGTFHTVINRDVTIEVEVTEEYPRLIGRSGNRMSIRLDYILSDDGSLAGRMENTFNAMYSNNTTG